MAFEGLTEKLNKVFKSLKNKGVLNEKDVSEAMREVKMALIEADVNIKIAKDFCNRCSERAVGANVMNSLTPGQQVIDIVHDELVSLMGGGADKVTGQTTAVRIDFCGAGKGPTVIMMCGLQGAGKTTHAAKLAKWLKSESRRPLIAACDIYRPAAIEQLHIVGEKAGANGKM